MQTDGNALRIELATFKTLFDSVPEIRTRALEYIQSKMLTLSQLAGCNRLHTVDQRLARMLLMVLDRSDSNILSLTQELLADLLGASRTTVTGAACLLQKNGIVAYSRGHLRVLDRSRLRLAACSCYPLVQQLYLKLYEDAARNNASWPAYLPVVQSPLVAKLLDKLSALESNPKHLSVILPPVSHLAVAPTPGFLAHA